MEDRAHRPHRLGANQVPVYYAGGAAITRFRGEAPGAGDGPEDWVASVTAFPPHLLPAGGDPSIGISRLSDGTLLRAAVRADPAGWLGDGLAAAYGGETGLLVKLLDAGERLPVHCHPSRAMARARLGSVFGKSEGWILLDVRPDAAMWLGFRRDVERGELREWIAHQDVTAMLAAMNRLEVRTGDVIFVPAGLPHAFGPGILLAELQEPTSFSILAEYRAYGLDERQATLGLSWDEALDCFDRQGYDEARLARLRPRPHLVADTDGGQVWRLFEAEADEYFQAYRLQVAGRLPLEGLGGFAILIVERGAGTLHYAGGTEALAAGQTWVIPHAAGPLKLEGSLEAIYCLPPRTGA